MPHGSRLEVVANVSFRGRGLGLARDCGCWPAGGDHNGMRNGRVTMGYQGMCGYRRGLIYLVLALATVPAHAQTPVVVTPVVVTGASASTSARQRADDAEGQSVGRVERMDADSITADRAEALFPMLPGVTPGVLQQGLSTGVIVRGFDASGFVFVNDLPDVGRMFVRDLATLESLQVRQGQASVLYGAGTPGGVLNYRLREAGAANHSRASFGITTEGNRAQHIQWRTELDVAWPATESRPIAWRLLAATQGGDAWQDVIRTDRGTVMADAFFRYASGQVRATAEWQRNHRQFSFGTVYVNGQVQYDKIYVGPEASSTRDTARVALDWQHSVASDWHARAQLQTAQVRRNETLQGYWTIASPTQLSGYYRRLNDDYAQHDLRLELAGKEMTGPVRHEISVGVESHATNVDFNAPQCIDCFRLKIDNPVFDVPGTQLTLNPRRQRDQSHQKAIYAFDRLQLTPKWAAEVGARRTWMSAVSSGSLADTPVWATTTDVADTVFSAALERRLSTREVLRASYDEAYLPNTGQDRNGQFVAPRRSSQRELSYRWRPSGGTGPTLHLNLFDVQQNNITARDVSTPVVPGAVKLIGARRSRGMDATWVQPMGDDWVVHFVGSYVQSKMTTKTSASQGDEPAGVPKLLGSVRVAREFGWPLAAEATLKCSGWFMQSGTGKRYGDIRNTFRVPGYGLTSLGANCGQGAWSASLSVSNLLGKRYVEGITAADDIYQGNPRRVSVFVSRNF